MTEQRNVYVFWNAWVDLREAFSFDSIILLKYTFRGNYKEILMWRLIINAIKVPFGANVIDRRFVLLLSELLREQ